MISRTYSNALPSLVSLLSRYFQSHFRLPLMRAPQLHIFLSIISRAFHYRAARSLFVGRAITFQSFRAACWCRVPSPAYSFILYESLMHALSSRLLLRRRGMTYRSGTMPMLASPRDIARRCRLQARSRCSLLDVIILFTSIQCHAAFI